MKVSRNYYRCQAEGNDWQSMENFHDWHIYAIEMRKHIGALHAFMHKNLLSIWQLCESNRANEWEEKNNNNRHWRIKMFASLVKASRFEWGKKNTIWEACLVVAAAKSCVNSRWQNEIKKKELYRLFYFCQQAEHNVELLIGLNTKHKACY